MKKNLVIENRFSKSLRPSLCRGSTVSGGLKTGLKNAFQKKLQSRADKNTF